MDLQKIYTDSDFSNADIPEGSILTYLGTDESGKVVTRYKDSQGNVGTISGGGEGGGGGADVTLGQIDADGNFQPLAFNGTEASNSGNPETVESYYGWNGVLPVPDKGIKVGEAAEYYKCATVDTASKTWSGYLAVLGEDGVYTFEETATTGLTYGTAYVPKIGGIYNDGATIEVKSMYSGVQPLTFTAKEAGATVSLNANGSPNVAGLQYKTNTVPDWQTYTAGTVITLANVGDYVQFWNTQDTLSLEWNNNFAQFSVNDSVEVSGNIMSLLNYREDCPDYCFFWLFYDTRSISGTLTLPAKAVGKGSYAYMFYNSSINGVIIEADATTTTGNDGLYIIFSNCTALSYIEVAFTTWPSTSVMQNWVRGISSDSGTFVKPSALPEEFGDSRIPTGWTVVNKD